VYVLSVTTTPKAWLGTSRIAAHCPRIKTALGLHPQLAHERYNELELFEKLLPQAKYVGEIGLDGGKEYKKHFDVQTEVFSRIVELLGSHGGRIMSLHTKQAVNEVLSILEKNPQAGPAILHWFTGTKKELSRAIDMGCWFSIGPGMISSEKGRSLISSMPLNKILLETDGPFTMNKNGNPFEPIHTLDFSSEIAKIINIQEDDLKRIFFENFKTLSSFNLSLNGNFE
jgi:TatD DNase family protein